MWRRKALFGKRSDFHKIPVGARRLLAIHARDGESDMHEYEIAGLGLRSEGQVHRSAHAAEIDKSGAECGVRAVNLKYLPWDRKTHAFVKVQLLRHANPHKNAYCAGVLLDLAQNCAFPLSRFRMR